MITELTQFQSLTGSIHTPYQVSSEFFSMVFQSLTGSIHTKITLMNFLFLKSFNPSQVQFTPNQNFQVAEIYHSFQSLTGSIHTETIEIGLNNNRLFQSLTGSIHTLENNQGRRVQIRVSIPHRFNSHKLNTLLLGKARLSFNPSQVQFTHCLNLKLLISYSRFNPSQVQFTHQIPSLPP